LKQIEALRDYAPLHNPVEAQYIEVFKKMVPWATEVAVFDTAFHQTMAPENYLYSIPYKYYKEYGARKYGAHGTSVRYVSARTAEFLGRDPKDLKLVVLHLGSGSSITAVKDGKSVDTSMGFTPLAGITMSTRSGDIDVSLVAYLMKKLNVDMDEMLEILNHESGVLGISELSQDQRDLKAVADTNPQAKLALEIYANRAAKYVAGYASVMGGIDALAFTGGVGENSHEMRQQIIERLGFLGAKIDPEVNAASHGIEKDLSTPDATIKTILMPTNEELMIVRDVFERLPQ
jgi:acetate kinase